MRKRRNRLRAVYQFRLRKEILISQCGGQTQNFIALLSYRMSIKWAKRTVSFEGKKIRISLKLFFGLENYRK